MKMAARITKLESAHAARSVSEANGLFQRWSERMYADEAAWDAVLKFHGYMRTRYPGASAEELRQVEDPRVHELFGVVIEHSRRLGIMAYLDGAGQG